MSSLGSSFSSVSVVGSAGTRPRVNLRSTAVKRIMQEASELANADIDEDGFVASPLENDIFEWHCTMRGVQNSEYEGGLYHLRILLPPSYPMSAPDIMLMTPNGRFELGKKICIDGLTSFHAGSWQPAWGVRTAVLGLRSFWMQGGEALSAIGALDYSKPERRRLARLSRDWKCPICNVKNEDIIPPSSSSATASASSSTSTSTSDPNASATVDPTTEVKPVEDNKRTPLPVERLEEGQDQTGIKDGGNAEGDHEKSNATESPYSSPEVVEGERDASATSAAETDAAAPEVQGDTSDTRPKNLATNEVKRPLTLDTRSQANDDRPSSSLSTDTAEVERNVPPSLPFQSELDDGQSHATSEIRHRASPSNAAPPSLFSQIQPEPLSQPSTQPQLQTRPSQRGYLTPANDAAPSTRLRPEPPTRSNSAAQTAPLPRRIVPVWLDGLIFAGVAVLLLLISKKLA